MKSVALIAICAVLAATATGQFVHPVDWDEVTPVYDVPSFFDRFPSLRLAFITLGGLNSYPSIAGFETSTQANHMVAIVSHFTDGNGFCAGTLISQNYVLTNAHCVVGAYSAIVVAGATNLTNPNESTQQRFISTEFVVHPNWVRPEIDSLVDDVALIKLPQAVVLSDLVQPIRLPTVFQLTYTWEDFEGVMTGWGSRYIFSEQQAIYQESAVRRFTFANITSVFSCRLSFPTLLDSNTMFCAEPEDFTGSFCPNDGGSAYYITENDGQNTLVGLASFASSFGCSRSRAYLTHRIVDYLFWIVSMSDIELRFY